MNWVSGRGRRNAPSHACPESYDLGALVSLARITSFRVGYVIPRWFVGSYFNKGSITSAEVRRSATQTKQARVLRKWNPSDLPRWRDEDVYRLDILPRLSKFTVKSIRAKIGVSHPYATLIRHGDTIPHPRHWLSLAELAGYQK
jgi:hypothetical protein